MADERLFDLDPSDSEEYSVGPEIREPSPVNSLANILEKIGIDEVMSASAPEQPFKSPVPNMRALRPVRSQEYLPKVPIKNIVVELIPIGAGAFSTVYKGRMLPDKTAVAVKVFNRKPCNHKEHKYSATAAFTHEWRMTAALPRSNHIITFFGAVEWPDYPALVFELSDIGCLLAYLVKNETAVDANEAISILRDVAIGLNVLHSATPPIVHRDLTSNNILLFSGRRAKIADFGASQHVRATTFDTVKPDAHLRFSTVETIPPESWLFSPTHDEQVFKWTPASDMYSYAIVATELAAVTYEGVHYYPFTYGVKWKDTRARDLYIQSGGLPKWPPMCNKTVASVIRRCLTRDPKIRASAQTLLDEIFYK